MLFKKQFEFRIYRPEGVRCTVAQQPASIAIEADQSSFQFLLVWRTHRVVWHEARSLSPGSMIAGVADPAIADYAVKSVS